MKTEQQKFIIEYLRFNDKVIAYKNAYNSDADYETMEAAADNLLSNPEVAELVNDTTAAIRSRTESEIAAEQKGAMLTVQKKRELLYEIATGQMLAEQSYKGKDCNVCTQYVRPTINHMLRAIQIDNQLAGHTTKKKSSPEFHNPVRPQAGKTQQKHHSHHPELDSGSGETRKTTLKNHNISQQKPHSHHPSRHPELDSGSGKTQTTTPKKTHRKKEIPVLLNC